MATQAQRIAPPGCGFRISNGPIAPLIDHDQVERGLDVIELPRVSGPPILFAIARDPRTIFTYWYIDWPSVFQKTAPADNRCTCASIGTTAAKKRAPPPSQWPASIISLCRSRAVHKTFRSAIP